MGIFDSAPKDASRPLRELLKDAEAKMKDVTGSSVNSERWNKLLCDYVEAMSPEIRSKESLLMLLEIVGQCIMYQKEHEKYLEKTNQKVSSGTTTH